MPRKRTPFRATPPRRSPADDRRPSAQERGYTKEWSRYRRRFLREHPLCAACQSEGRLVPATVVDHIVPHRGDRALFWDPANHQPLCATHHSRKTCQEDGGFGRPRKSRE